MKGLPYSRHLARDRWHQRIGAGAVTVAMRSINCDSTGRRSRSG